MSETEVLTLKSAAKVLHMHPKVVARYARTKGLPGHKVGRDWRFLRSEILEWIRTQKGAA